MFVDKAIITVKGGDGGNGCISFRREKFVPKGGPDGGDGGDGGSIILIADAGEQSFVDFVYNRTFQGGRGPHGKGKTLHGKNVQPTMVRIPVGTVIKDADTGEFLADLDEKDKTFVAAAGGRGGRGNARFVTSVNRVPRVAEEGKPGEERRLDLELKSIADIGLVGYPNAGKSTLIGKISNAHPKTAPYPFTTLHPVVGVIEYPDYSRVTVADIPGLIDGAHDNVGLGHEFLRHIERTSVLVYVLDTAGVDGRNPLDDFESLRKELEMYQEGLSHRPAVIVANKIDLPGAGENLEEISKALPEYKVFAISATSGEQDFEPLKDFLRRQVLGN